MDNRSNIWRGVDTIKPRFVELSDRVWAMPEVCYTEARSSAEHLAELRHQGFRVTEQVAGIPTAVMGEWGEGGPVIAFLGEFDAEVAGIGGGSQQGRADSFALKQLGARLPRFAVCLQTQDCQIKSRFLSGLLDQLR